MSKRIACLVMMAVLVIGVGDVSAFHRINGVVISHSDPEITVTLTGNPGVDTILIVTGTLLIEILCKNPQDKSINPGTPEFQEATVSTAIPVTSDQFSSTGQATVTVVVPVSDSRCHQKNFKKVTDSELVIGATVTTDWQQCQQKGNRLVCDSTRQIEVVSFECGSGVRNADGTVSPQEITCAIVG